MTPADLLTQHISQLRACRRCPGVLPPPVLGSAPQALVYLYGQAPGPREQALGKPFAGPAGRTLFRWLATLGVSEDTFRQRVWMGACLRCFPGKQATGQGGDRRPTAAEMARCQPHLLTEIELLRPGLLIPVGGMAMAQVGGLFGEIPRRLDQAVGKVFPLAHGSHRFQAIPLPHPSGLSRWTQTPQGKALLAQALANIQTHPAWVKTFG